jgi:uncharacterized protein (TIGR02145 family)
LSEPKFAEFKNVQNNSGNSENSGRINRIFFNIGDNTMRTKLAMRIIRPLLAAALGLAITLTLSCSSGGDGGGIDGPAAEKSSSSSGTPSSSSVEPSSSSGLSFSGNSGNSSSSLSSSSLSSSGGTPEASSSSEKVSSSGNSSAEIASPSSSSSYEPPVLIPNPDPPANVVTQTNSTSSISIGWGVVSGATGYYIYRSTSTVGPYARVGTSETALYTDNDLSDGTAYYYKVAAYNSGGEGSQSDAVSATTLPVAPTGVTAAANSATSITIGWSSVTGATSYRVYRSSTASGTYEEVGTSTSTTYTDNDLSGGTAYYYRISGYNSGGEGSQSSYATATTRVGIPTGVKVEISGTRSITIGWSSVTGATGYRVYRSSTASGTYEEVGTSTTASYTNSSLTAGTAYYYKVSAYNSGGEGSQSAAVSATTKPYGTVSDGVKSYRTVVIGTQTWMAENLNYNASGSRCFGDNTGGDSQGRCTTYGRLYNWATAMAVCPTGWHLPSHEEWIVLTDFVGDLYTAGTKLKSADGWVGNDNGTDDYGFSALLCGLGNSVGVFYDVGNGGYWWSSSEYSSDNAYSWGMGYGSENVYYNSGGKDHLFSVRCLQD